MKREIRTVAAMGVVDKPDESLNVVVDVDPKWYAHVQLHERACG